MQQLTSYLLGAGSPLVPSDFFCGSAGAALIAFALDAPSQQLLPEVLHCSLFFFLPPLFAEAPALLKLVDMDAALFSPTQGDGHSFCTPWHFISEDWPEVPVAEEDVEDCCAWLSEKAATAKRRAMSFFIDN
jgi:hypothetical protein